MNTENYASLEASQRLFSSGIVLETEKCWIQLANGKHSLTNKRKPRRLWFRDSDTPAPSMAEVWRELPKGTGMEMRDGYTLCWLFGAETFKNTNPVDALIDLLILVVERKGKV